MPESRPELESSQRWIAAGLALSISAVAAAVLRLRNGNEQSDMQQGGWAELDLGLPEPSTTEKHDVATYPDEVKVSKPRNNGSWRSRTPGKIVGYLFNLESERRDHRAAQQS